MQKTKKKRSVLMNKGKWFSLIVFALVVGQWLVFYVYSRFNSIFTSFQYYQPDTDTFHFLPFNDLFRNYKYLFTGSGIFEFVNVWELIWNGYKFYFISFVVNQFSIIIAFYIYKNYKFSGIMMLTMMVPNCLAGLVQPLLFRYLVTYVVPAITGEEISLFFNVETALPTVLVMNAFFAFPGGMLFYVSQFGKVAKELTEAAALDGVTPLKEFWYIAFPSVYQIWSLGLLGILTSGLMQAGPGYTLYGDQGYKYGIATLNYHLTVQVLVSDKKINFPVSASVNMILAIISIIGINIMKRIFERIDPYKEKDM